jgi:hypothetical protein
MKRHVWIRAFLLILVTGGRGLSGEPGRCEPGGDGVLRRWHPVGGWDPYGGGLLHWWNPHCFPRCGAPDDYCRKLLPRICWPPYPPYYIWGPPRNCSPHGNS